MKEKIYEAIKLQNGKLSFNNLKKKFMLDTDTLKNILLELKLDGKILQTSNKYILFPSDNYIGEISLTQSGNKIIFYNGERIALSSDFFNNVILNDVVSFRLNKNKEAEITSIIDRKLGNITCEVINDNGKKRIVPYHLGIDISLPKEITKDLIDGDIILVNVTPNDVSDYCDATFVKKLPISKNDPNKREILTAINYGFDNDYSDEYLEELKKYPKEVCEDEIGTRCDYRRQKSFTIDGINTKDMDDGVFGERIANNLIRVYVHISDVSHYVKPGSLVFERACEKTTSAYIGNSALHMLHHVISNGICSLNPCEDRLTKTVVMDIDENGEIVNFEVVKSAICSKKKMNYDDVDSILLNKDIPLGYEEFVDTLNILHEASLRLENKFVNVDGKINFASNELKKIYNSDGSIRAIYDPEYSPGSKLIENLMIAANKTVATWLYWSSIPSVYRIHEVPDLNKINMAIEMMNLSGYKMKFINNADSPKVIQKLLNKISNTDEFPVLSGILVQFMQRARYSVENVGHYALGADAYTHFTSPIRRLPDLLVHMIVDLILESPDKIDKINFREMEKNLQSLCSRASKMERQADAASKDMEQALLVENLAKSIGEVFTANVCDIDKKIRIRVNGIDCVIDKEDLADNFKYDKTRKLYYDNDNGSYIKLGAKLLVQIKSINIVNRSVRLSVLAVQNNKIKKKTLN